jgi:hypothetical protein
MLRVIREARGRKQAATVTAVGVLAWQLQVEHRADIQPAAHSHAPDNAKYASTKSKRDRKRQHDAARKVRLSRADRRSVQQ